MRRRVAPWPYRSTHYACRVVDIGEGGRSITGPRLVARNELPWDDCARVLLSACTASAKDVEGIHGTARMILHLPKLSSQWDSPTVCGGSRHRGALLTSVVGDRRLHVHGAATTLAAWFTTIPWVLVAASVISASRFDR